MCLGTVHSKFIRNKSAYFLCWVFAVGKQDLLAFRGYLTHTYTTTAQ